MNSSSFTCARNSAHPFIQTLVAYHEGTSSAYDGSPLQKFYRHWQPRSAAMEVGIAESEAHAELATRSPFGGALPWDFKTPAEHEAFWRGICERDYRENGFELDASDGWKGWGPMSPQAGDAEFQRLIRIYKSMQQHGYRRHDAMDGDIEEHILRYNESSRILVARGQHRIAALAATGAVTAPIRLFPMMIARSDNAIWPNVVRGYYTREQALSVFDRMFAGQQPFA